MPECSTDQAAGSRPAAIHDAARAETPYMHESKACNIRTTSGDATKPENRTNVLNEWLYT